MKKLLLSLIIAVFVIITLSAESNIQDRTIDWLESKNISPEGIVLIISMLPIIELRGAIPVGMFLFRFAWYKAALLSIAGNMIPIPFVLLFLFKLMNRIHNTKMGYKLTDWLYKKTKRKSKILDRYKAAGLAIFVGIPLPGTGAWTGAFAAEIFGFKFWKSLLFIFIGVLMAAVAVTFLCEMGVIVFKN